MLEILKNTGQTLSIVFSAGYADGEVTVTITDADGTAIVDAQNAEKDADVAGRYTYELDPQADLTWLVVTWAGTFSGTDESITTGAGEVDATSSEVQVVGGHVFTIAELRAFGDGKLNDPVAFPDEMLIEKRSAVTFLAEQFCDVAFRPRYGQATLDGNWRRTIWLPNRRITALRKITVGGVPLDAPTLANVKFYPSGKLVRVGWWPLQYLPQNIVVGYEHGYPYCPPDLARMLMLLARYELVQSELGERFVSFTNEVGTTRIAQPDEEHPTGIPLVDSTLRRYDTTHPVEAY